MAKKDELSEEHLALLREAEELGVDTLGYSVKGARLDRLREAIARRTEALARAASTRAKREAEDDEEIEHIDDLPGAFDEVMGSTRGVLVRIAEWTEWIPLSKSPHLSQLTLANGVSGLEAGENERLLSVEGIGTQRVKTVDTEDGTVAYMLYAFKATLAQNVHTKLVTTLVEAQGSNMEGEAQKPKPASGLVLPDDGAARPNRQQRRHPNG